MDTNIGVTLQVVPLTVQSANGVTTQILALAPCATQTTPTKTPTKILPKTELPSHSPSSVPEKNDNHTSTVSPKSLLRCKRRIDFGKFGLPQTKPASVSRRNERERNRVKLVNNGFDALRRHIPAQDSKNQKISKVETLRLATEYIKHLQQILEDQDAVNAVFANNIPPSPLSPCDSLSSSASYSSCGDSLPPLSPGDEDLLDFNSWFS